MSEEFKTPYQNLTDININNLIVERNALIQQNQNLNNILTEIEEWLKEEIKKLEINIQFEREQAFLIQYHIYGHCLDKITELKEKYK